MVFAGCVPLAWGSLGFSKEEAIIEAPNGETTFSVVMTSKFNVATCIALPPHQDEMSMRTSLTTSTRPEVQYHSEGQSGPCVHVFE